MVLHYRPKGALTFRHSPKSATSALRRTVLFNHPLITELALLCAAPCREALLQGLAAC